MFKYQMMQKTNILCLRTSILYFMYQRQISNLRSNYLRSNSHKATDGDVLDRYGQTQRKILQRISAGGSSVKQKSSGKK